MGVYEPHLPGSIDGPHCRSCTSNHFYCENAADYVMFRRQLFIAPFPILGLLNVFSRLFCDDPWALKEVMQVSHVGLSTKQSLPVSPVLSGYINHSQLQKHVSDQGWALHRSVGKNISVWKPVSHAHIAK